MSVRWITQFLGTAAGVSYELGDGVFALDVRDLVDKAGNSPERVEQKIAAGVAAARQGLRVVVCCDYGISRSNAIAAGVLARIKGSKVDLAAREVIAATGEAEIKLELLDIVRAVVDGAGDALRLGQRSGPILVTGANGFLGRTVLRQLKERGVEFVCPPRTELDLLSGRVQLDMLIRASAVARVIHLANPRVYTSNLALGETLVMLRNLLETCALNEIPLIYLSGWEVYSGYRTTFLRADESLPLLPAGIYGETKFLCEGLINHFRNTTSLQCALMRLSPIYGRGGERPKFIHTFIEKARRGEPIVTHQYANGSPALDLLHIDDAAAAICKVACGGFVGDLNIGTGQLTTTRQVAEWIVEWCKSRSTVESISINKDTACIAMDSSKATREIGWKAAMPVSDGLRALFEKELR